MKRNYPIYLVILLLIFVFTSCGDRDSNIEYVIDNQSSKEINIISSFRLQIDETNANTIAPSSNDVIFLDAGIGNTKRKLNGMTTIPFDSIIITNMDGLRYKKDPLPIDNWERELVESNIGIVTLVVTDADF